MKTMRLRPGFLRWLRTVVLVTMVLIPGNTSVSDAKQSVSDLRELKNALRSEGSLTIELKQTITVRETLTVRGKKILQGPGELRRAISQQSAFGGTLLRLAGGSLLLRQITIDGRGDAEVLKGRLYGRLIQVEGGQLTIGEGTVLTGNKNLTRASDGGGALRISGGSCVMNAGLITGNASVTAGAGVRVDSGGVFTIKGGRISGNRVKAMGAVRGFDGRGGGVYNAGTMAVYGGQISDNTVSSYADRTTTYGGAGGGIANMGELLIRGGLIKGNKGTKGRDIAQIRGRIAADGKIGIGTIWLRRGQVFHVGTGFSVSSRIRLEPEKVSDGVKLADGLTRKKAERCILVGDSVSRKKWNLPVEDGTLMIRAKRPEITRHPAATEKPAVTEPVSSTKRPQATSYPSYIPVATLDPKAEIWPSAQPDNTPTVPFGVPTRPPTFYAVPATASATSVAVPTMTPGTPTPVPTASPVVSPTVPPVQRTPLPSPTPLSDPRGSLWFFTSREISVWKRQLQTERESNRTVRWFLLQIESNRREGSYGNIQ